MIPTSHFKSSLESVLVVCLVLVICASSSALAQDLPEDPYERGLVLLKQFKYGEAKASFDQVISLDPNHINAYYQPPP